MAEQIRKKLHLAIDPHNGKLVLAEITNEYIHDTHYLEQSLRKMNRRQGRVFFDGIADSKRCYEMVQRYNKHLITPPKRRAVIRKERGYEKRNEAIQIIEGLGGDKDAKSIVKKTNHFRQLLLSTIFHQKKFLFMTM